MQMYGKFCGILPYNSALLGLVMSRPLLIHYLDNCVLTFAMKCAM